MRKKFNKAAPRFEEDDKFEELFYSRCSQRFTS